MRMHRLLLALPFELFLQFVKLVLQLLQFLRLRAVRGRNRLDVRREDIRLAECDSRRILARNEPAGERLTGRAPD